MRLWKEGPTGTRDALQLSQLPRPLPSPTWNRQLAWPRHKGGAQCPGMHHACLTAPAEGPS